MSVVPAPSIPKASLWTRFRKALVRDRWLYLLLLPGLIYFIICKYLPMWGIVSLLRTMFPIPVCWAASGSA